MARSMSDAPGEVLLPEVTKDTRPMMMNTGSTKAATLTQNICLGDLMGPVWASSCVLSLMASSGGRSGLSRGWGARHGAGCGRAVRRA